MGQINLHLYPSNFTHETRILKITKTLADAGVFEEIHIGAMWEEGLEETERIDERRRVWRVRLRASALPRNFVTKSLKFLEWMAVIFLRYRKQDVRVVNCHSLSVLPLGVAFKLFKRSTLVYDTHELETETDALGRFRKLLFKALEASLIPFVNFTVVVSDSIADWYRKRYGLKNIEVIKNVPYRPKNLHASKNSILREKFHLAEDDIVFLYQGVLGKSRCIEPILAGFSKPLPKKHIVFLGYGDLEALIQEQASKHSNIHFHPAVKPDELQNYTEGADVGFALLEDCLNNRYALPNKIFQYLFAGLPVITRDFPEMGRIIVEYGCGWKVSADAQSLQELVNRLTREEIRLKRASAIACQGLLGWEAEEQKLLRIYSESLASCLSEA
jgi:glycosyltransferase involved in cell wall biosynthesis